MSTEPTQWPPLDEDARVIWPTDPHERAQLAKKLFSLEFVAAMDNYLDYATDKVTNPRPAKPFEGENWLSGLDKVYRQSFSSMSDRQKQIVLRLVRDVVYGVLLQTLTGLDQFHVDVKIALVGKGPEDQAVDVPVTSIETGLAEQFVLATEEFSKYWTQLAGDLESPPQL